MAGSIIQIRERLTPRKDTQGFYGLLGLLEVYPEGTEVSKRGDCFDNAVAESFFGRLKSEMIYLRTTFSSRAEARLEILKYLMWYNAERIHSTLGYVSPNKFEKEYVTKMVA